MALKCRTLPADSADSAAVVLARTYWPSCATVVVCREDAYADALVAATLAARLRAPLLLAGEKGLSQAAMAELKRLAARQVILIGAASKAGAAMEKQRLAVTRLADAKAVLTWMHIQRKMDVSYLAVSNPHDRERGVIRKLSLSAPLLAAGRNGALIPLDFETQWKIPFKSVDLKGQPGKSLKTGDTVSLNGKKWSVSLYPECAKGEGDIRLTYPCGAEVRDRLFGIYKILHHHPEYLCIVGMPDVIPFNIVPKGPEEAMDLPTDLPYANTDDDPFVEIAYGRVIAEDFRAATLYASRVLTYADLLDPSWSNKCPRPNGNPPWPRAFRTWVSIRHSTTMEKVRPLLRICLSPLHQPSHMARTQAGTNSATRLTGTQRFFSPRV